jgi:hypothetical protein
MNGQLMLGTAGKIHKANPKSGNPKRYSGTPGGLATIRMLPESRQVLEEARRFGVDVSNRGTISRSQTGSGPERQRQAAFFLRGDCSRVEP